MLDLQSYFDRPVRAWGMFQKRNGAIARRFSVWIEPHWQGPRGTLHERFVYDDGTESTRDWFLTQVDDRTWRGEAEDIIGGATGIVDRDQIRWRYVLRLPINGRPMDFRFDDRMFLVGSDTILNTSRMYKFGIHLGNVTMSYRREDTRLAEPRMQAAE
jgi:hypothetical protein